MQTSYRALQLVMTLFMTNASLNAGDYIRTSTKKVNSEVVRCYTPQEITGSRTRTISIFEHMHREYPEHRERITKEKAQCMLLYREIESNCATSRKPLTQLEDRAFYFFMDLAEPIEPDNRSPEHFWGIKAE